MKLKHVVWGGAEVRKSSRNTLHVFWELGRNRVAASARVHSNLLRTIKITKVITELTFERAVLFYQLFKNNDLSMHRPFPKRFGVQCNCFRGCQEKVICTIQSSVQNKMNKQSLLKKSQWNDRFQQVSRMNFCMHIFQIIYMVCFIRVVSNTGNNNTWFEIQSNEAIWSRAWCFDLDNTAPVWRHHVPLAGMVEVVQGISIGKQYIVKVITAFWFFPCPSVRKQVS